MNAEAENKKTAGEKKTVTRRAPAKKGPEELKWRAFLAPEHPWKTVIVLILLAGITLVIGKYVYDIVPGETGTKILPAILAGVLVFLLFFGSFNLYFVPVNYHFNTEEIVIRKFYHKERREWKMFRRYFFTRSGVVFSTFSTRQRFLDNFRGVQILLPADDEKRKKVLDFIGSKLPLDAGQDSE